METKLLIGGTAVALAAVLVATPVMSDAAGQITGKQIKNGSIKGKDVKDDSLKGKDIAESTLGTVPDASRLAGKDPSAYTTPIYRYRMRDASSSETKSFRFPGLPAGTYTYDWSVVIEAGATTAPACEFRADPGVDVVSSWNAAAYDGDGYWSSNGGASATVGATAPELLCYGSADFAIYNGEDYPSTLTFTRVDAVTNGNATATQPSSMVAGLQ